MEFIRPDYAFGSRLTERCGNQRMPSTRLLVPIICLAHLPGSFGQPPNDRQSTRRITARHFARAVEFPKCQGLPVRQNGIPSSYPSSRKAATLSMPNRVSQCEPSFRPIYERSAEIRPRRQRRQLTPAVCKQLGSMARSRRFCVESLAARTDASPCSSFKRSCVRWTHTKICDAYPPQIRRYRGAARLALIHG